jgi:hypothetical protein
MHEICIAVVAAVAAIAAVAAVAAVVAVVFLRSFIMRFLLLRLCHHFLPP